ncbi:uncharacterized protein TNCV_144701 [Trichonephila clavipes]|nr:uncharacterized protein TNCV_144701 [Trichonephila clavipes]
MLRRPLQQPYDGPFKVLQRKDKVFFLDINGKRVSVSIDRCKPAFFLNTEDLQLPQTKNETPATVEPNATASTPATVESEPTASTPTQPSTRSGRKVHLPTRYSDSFLQLNSSTMRTLIISKEIKERQKYFPWLKIFIKELFKKFPLYDSSLKYLSENVENEIAALSDNDGDKIKIEALFETIDSLFLHFWWKIHWAENCQWKKYWKIDAPYSYCCNELTKYAGKLLYYLIYLGIILSKGVSNSIWINRILQAINVFPSADDVVYSSLLQITKLKKKQCHVYMNILK